MAMLDSAVGGAHYSGVESVNERRRSMRRHSDGNSAAGGVSSTGVLRRQSVIAAEPNPAHLTVLDDIKDVRDFTLDMTPQFFMMVA